MLDPHSALTQQAIDRARAQALRIFQRATAELRRLQTERQVRNETVPDNFDAGTLGLASCKDLGPVLVRDVKRQLLLHKPDRTEMLSPWPNRPRQNKPNPSPEAPPVPVAPAPNTKGVAVPAPPPYSPPRLESSRVK